MSLFTLLKALAKRSGNIFAIAFKSEKKRYSWKSDNFRERAIKKEARTDTKKVAKMIKSDNFTRSNREVFNIAIAILEN